MHGPGYKSLTQSQAKTLLSKYYSASRSNTQYFKLPRGTVAPGQSNQRIEAYAPTWRARSSRDWHSWKGTFYVAKTGQSAALLQMKSPDKAVQWECQLKLDKSGNIYLQNRLLGNKSLVSNTKGKAFTFYIRSNGREFRGWVDQSGRKKYFNYPHQMDATGNSTYAFRWGLYVLSTASDHEVRCWDISYR